MRIRTALATAVIAAGLVTAGNALPATAATPPKHNVLAGFCSSHRHHDCVAEADNDEGVFTVRNHAGHLVRFGHHTGRIARYLDRHATPCAQEDSAHCWWNAGTAGNGQGDSFLVIGGHREGTGSVYYLGDFS